LQRGPQAAELATAPLEITNLEEEGNQITDTAAILANLDLLISVDTMVAHLAGALGRPVWTLLAHVPDWRWLLDREDSPWYPTMRLLRQPQPGNWEAVIQQVARELTDAERG
jgi:ADP-heptose:LPS heptosyltransferase